MARKPSPTLPTDADGDTNREPVLQIHNNDDPVINGLDVNGGELTVYELNLLSRHHSQRPGATR